MKIFRARSKAQKISNQPIGVLASEFVEYVTSMPNWGEVAKLREEIRKNPVDDGRYPPPWRYWKYLDPERWAKMTVSVGKSLNLRDGQPGHHLDLGSGAGYLLAYSQMRGHQSVGVDLGHPLFALITDALGVSSVEHKISPWEPIPLEVEQKFDYISAVSIEFDQISLGPGNGSRWWTTKEWASFLAVIRNRLTNKGRVYLRVNVKSPGIDFYSEEVNYLLSNSSVWSKGREFVFDRRSLDRVKASKADEPFVPVPDWWGWKPFGQSAP